MSHDEYFEQLAEAGPGDAPGRAPAALKARLYSSLIREQQASGPLEPLSSTRQHGRKLCVFERLVEIAPVGEPAKAKFVCTVCHARLLAERLDRPPVWWPHCPYSQFKTNS